MSIQDLVDTAGWFLLAWGIGYTTGFLFKSVRIMFENAVGGGG